ncbi:hypothetical protein PM082_009532 [Marasmius tenuissimus]|nr:hypothetical protein PM082_009532 [Marasmius tenuissimus]
MSNLIRLDDRDPRISYTPASDWRKGGADLEYQKTTKGTSAAGARMTFTFTGSYIAVYGTISHKLTTLPASNTFTLTMSGKDTTHSSTWTAAPSANSIYNAKMYESPQAIEYGLYTLVMNVGVKGSDTWIDYLELNQTDPNANSKPSTSSSRSSTPNSTPTVATGSATGSGLSSGAIAGIVVGVVALLVGAFVFVWWWRKLHQISGEKRLDEKFTADPTGSIDHTTQYFARPGSTGGFSSYQFSNVQQSVDRITSNSPNSDLFGSTPKPALLEQVPRNGKRALRYLTNDVPPAYSA